MTSTTTNEYIEQITLAFKARCDKLLSIKTRIHDNPFDDIRDISIGYTTLSITEIVDYLSKNGQGTCNNIFKIDFISKSLVDLEETDSKVFTDTDTCMDIDIDTIYISYGMFYDLFFDY